MAHYLQCFESALGTHQQGPGFSFLMARTYVSENRVPLDPLANHHSSQWQWPCLGMFGVYNPCSDTHHMDMMLSPWYLHVSWWNPTIFHGFSRQIRLQCLFPPDFFRQRLTPSSLLCSCRPQDICQARSQGFSTSGVPIQLLCTHPYYPYPSHPNVKWTIKHTR